MSHAANTRGAESASRQWPAGSALYQRLRNRPYSEHEQSLVLIPILNIIVASNEIQAAANKIIHTIAPPHDPGVHIVSLTSSVGIATYPDGGRTLDELISHADSAMYLSKRSGGRSFCLDGVLQTQNISTPGDGVYNA